MGVDTPIHHPNAKRIQARRRGGLPSQRRRRGDPAKATGHTLETPAGTGESVGRTMDWPYSIIADPYRLQIFELLPLNYTAYSLRGTHAATGHKIETNHSGAMHPQVALVGYARDMHRLTDLQLGWLAEQVWKPILELCGIENRWEACHGTGEGMILASTRSPIRLSERQCWAYSGVLHHQHWYGQDHWDAGNINERRIQALIGAGGDDDMADTPLEDWNKTYNGSSVDRYNSIVQHVQEFLRGNGQPTLAVDGLRGLGTNAALSQWTAANGGNSTALLSGKEWATMRAHMSKGPCAPAAGDEAATLALTAKARVRLQGVDDVLDEIDDLHDG